MAKKKLTKKETELLNSNIGLKSLFNEESLDIEKSLSHVKHVNKLKQMHVELLKLQSWVIKNDKKIVILFEGRDAAGKGGTIRRIAEHINPRHYRMVALGIPTEDENKQWFFQRYINQLPKPGEIVFFDRSWYNRAVVEPVNGFCTQEKYKIFMSQVNDFERMLIQSEIHLIKFFFSITKEEQARRFGIMKKNPLKKWKLTPLDEKAQELWDEQTRYEKKMFETTDTKKSPWIIIDANDNSHALMKAINHILDIIPYKKQG